MYSKKGVILATLASALGIGSALGDGKLCSIVTYTVTGDYVWSPTATASPSSNTATADAFPFEGGFHGLPWPKHIHPALMNPTTNSSCPTDGGDPNSSLPGAVRPIFSQVHDYGSWLPATATGSPRNPIPNGTPQEPPPFYNSTTGGNDIGVNPIQTMTNNSTSTSINNSPITTSPLPNTSSTTISTSMGTTTPATTTTTPPVSTGSTSVSCAVVGNLRVNASCECAYSTFTCTQVIPYPFEITYNVPRSNSTANDFNYCMNYCDNEGDCLSVSYQISTGNCILYGDTVRNATTAENPDYIAAELIANSCNSFCSWLDF